MVLGWQHWQTKQTTPVLLLASQGGRLGAEAPEPTAAGRTRAEVDKHESDDNAPIPEGPIGLLQEVGCPGSWRKGRHVHPSYSELQQLALHAAAAGAPIVSCILSQFIESRRNLMAF